MNSGGVQAEIRRATHFPTRLGIWTLGGLGFVGAGGLELWGAHPEASAGHPHRGTGGRVERGDMAGSKIGTPNGLPWQVETWTNTCGRLVV